jgi:hypothetical protein
MYGNGVLGLVRRNLGLGDVFGQTVDHQTYVVRMWEQVNVVDYFVGDATTNEPTGNDQPIRHIFSQVAYTFRQAANEPRYVFV